MPTKNIVTGATGIVGSHVLLALLQDNQEVIACKQKQSNTQNVKKLFACYTSESDVLFNKIKWVDIDLKDQFSLEDAFEGADCVYHCAGFVSFNSFEKKQLMEINVNGTQNVVNACLTKKVDTLCYVSSLATLHNLDAKTAINESVFWKTSGKESDYAFSKYKAELEAWRGVEEGLKTVIVNPGVVLSPIFWNQSSARMFNTCYKGNKFYPPGNTGYVAARDVAACMLQLVKHQQFGQRFILIEGNYSFKTIFTHIQKAFNKRPPSIQTSKLVLKLGWFVESILAFITDRPAILTKALINSALNKQEYSNQKIKHTLAYQFEPSLKCIDMICLEYLKDRGLR